MRFLRFVLLACSFCFLRCHEKVQNVAINHGHTDSLRNYQWTELTSNAAFPKGYNFQLFSIRDTLWVLQTAGSWYSIDGRQWQKSSLTNIINNNAFLDYIWFNNSLYALGVFEGNIEQHNFKSAVFKTSDMRTWDTLAKESSLPERFFYHPFVFRNKIWIIGGSDGGASFSDIWNSSDGVNWIKQAENLPFGKRENSQFVLFHDTLYMLNNDVWSSTDGITWMKITDRLATENVFGYAPVVYDEKIWLMGCNRDGLFQSQVLSSADGMNWSTSDAPWTPRGAAAACLHKGQVVLTGGKYGGLSEGGRTTEFVYSNDVWAFSSSR